MKTAKTLIVAALVALGLAAVAAPASAAGYGGGAHYGGAHYGGHYGGDNDNHYSFFSASGMDFIVIYLEYDTSANPAVLAWANNLLQTYSDRRGIIVKIYEQGQSDLQAGGGEAFAGAPDVVGVRSGEALLGELDLSRENRVEHGVGDGVAHLVRVALGDRLGGEQVLALRHNCLLLTASQPDSRLDAGQTKGPRLEQTGASLRARGRSRSSLIFQA